MWVNYFGNRAGYILPIVGKCAARITAIIDKILICASAELRFGYTHRVMYGIRGL